MHYNDTLPDLSNVLQKQSWQVLSRLDIETIGPVSLSLLHWQFILGEWIDKHIRKVILAPKNVIQNLQDDWIERN